MDYFDLLEDYEGQVDIFGDADAYVSQISKVPRKIQNLIALNFFVSQVVNGGLLQFFSNSSGVVAPEAVVALAEINQVRAGEILKTAMKHFGNDYPRNRETRQSYIKETYILEGKLPSPFNMLDDELFELGGNVMGMYLWLDKYAEEG